VELFVDCFRSDLLGMELAPELTEARVVLAPAERAGAVPRRERGRLVEEE
jgi:hypothetical protein